MDLNVQAVTRAAHAIKDDARIFAPTARHMEIFLLLPAFEVIPFSRMADVVERSSSDSPSLSPFERRDARAADEQLVDWVREHLLPPSAGV